MPSEIKVIDRLSGKEFSEKVFGEKGLLFLYEKEGFFSKIVKFLMAKTIFPSALFAYFQSKKQSRKKILPFIRKFAIDAHEFVKGIDEFSSFADFFVRQLKPQYRPILWDEKKAILPADARYFLCFKRSDRRMNFLSKDHLLICPNFYKMPLLQKNMKRAPW